MTYSLEWFDDQVRKAVRRTSQYDDDQKMRSGLTEARRWLVAGGSPGPASLVVLAGIFERKGNSDA